MEFLKSFLEIWRNLKDSILCGRKRKRSEDMMREEENLFFSFKKRRFAEPKFSPKKFLFHSNSLKKKEMNFFYPINKKEIIRNISRQSDVIFADGYGATKIKNLKMQNLNKEENFSNLSERENLQNNINQEYSPEFDDRHKSTNDNNNFVKFTFKKIQCVDLISEASINESNKNINEMPVNRIENQLDDPKINEDINIINISDHIENLPPFIEILNSENEDYPENQENNKYSINSRNNKNTDNSNNKPKFSFLHILGYKEESIVPDLNEIDTSVEEYNEIIKNISIHSDSNNFPIFSHNQYKKYYEFISSKLELDLPSFINIAQESLKKLLPGNWLNDEVVNSYIHLIHKRQNEDNINTKYRYAKVFIFNTYFYEKLKNLQKQKEYSYEKMSKFWTNKNTDVNLFDYDYVMIPVNSNNLHWSLVTVNLNKKKFTYFDSLEDNGHIVMNNLTRLFTDYVSKVKDNKDEDSGLVYARKRNSICEEEVTNRLSTSVASSNYLNSNFHIRSNFNSDECESDSESDIDMMSSFWKFKVANTPKQLNGVDCGVFLCKFMDYLSRDELINFTQQDINYFRHLMAIEIIEGKLLTI